MIQSIKVTNYKNQSLTIDMMRPEQSGLIIEAIEGLGPPKAEINMTEMAGLDGATFNTARVSLRNIVFRFRYMHKPDIETTRQNTYKYFPIKTLLDLQINTDNRSLRTTGYVESNEPNIFSNESGCVISILCPNSYLLDEFNSITGFSTVTSLFEFPFSNESLVSPLLEMSELTFDTTKSVVYEGDAPIGCVFHIHSTGSANDVTITETETLDTIEIDSAKLISITGSDISTGDDIYISTVRGDKYAILIRGSNTYNILSALGQDPTWFELHPGDNLFAFTADSGLSYLQFEVINEVAFEGV